ncbi:MAG: hypothetical protein NT038_05485, partial [Euryarchaeota archaeon]|nr:hypothetical protein [Euryarchaeota archaeon]
MRKCKICFHEDRRAIELDIISGTPVRQLSQKWGFDKSLFCRHKKHIEAEYLIEQALSPHPVCTSVPAIIETAVSVVSEQNRLDGREVKDAIRIMFDE